MLVEKTVKEKSPDSKKGYIYATIFVVAVGLLAIGTELIKIRYSETLNMGWMLAYTFLNQMWSHVWVLILLVFLIYVFRKIMIKYKVYILSFVLIYMALTSPDSLSEYQVNGEKANFVEIITNVLKDIMEDEYEVISCNECEIISKTFRGGRNSSSKRAYYYLSINDETYILPIPYGDKSYFSKLMSEENGIYEIKVRSNTKFIVEVNGMSLNELTQHITKN